MSKAQCRSCYGTWVVADVWHFKLGAAIFINCAVYHNYYDPGKCNLYRYVDAVVKKNIYAFVHVIACACIIVAY